MSCFDINEEWEKAWDELDRQRELAWHWNYEGRDPVLGSLALLEIASGAISWKLELENKEVLFKLWKKLLTYVYSLWVKRSDYFAETCQRTLVRCVVWGVTLFKDLKKCIPVVIDIICNNSELYTYIVLSLHANGIEGQHIVDEFQTNGLDLLELMEETIEWSDLYKKRGMLKNLPTSVKSFCTNLELTGLLPHDFTGLFTFYISSASSSNLSFLHASQVSVVILFLLDEKILFA